MRLSYRVVNVFTQEGGRLTGNPLCVFEDGTGLSAEQMQALALQFNLSETTFVTASDKADARVRIFTPTYEMPWAGHPTLGTASVVNSLKSRGGSVSLEFNVGVVPVALTGRLWEFRANKGKTRDTRATKAALASALGLSESDMAGEPRWIDSGTEQLIVPLATEDAVRKASVSFDQLRDATADGPRAQMYVFTRRPDGTVLSRFFFSKGPSILEDPATGSATANLGAWYLENGATLPFAVNITQGDMTGRPSSLRLRIDEQREVFVAGEVIEVARGEFEL